jgi:hypothetical protein
LKISKYGEIMISVSKLFEQGVTDMQTGDGRPTDWTRMGLEGKLTSGMSTGGTPKPNSIVHPDEKHTMKKHLARPTTATSDDANLTQ